MNIKVINSECWLELLYLDISGHWIGDKSYRNDKNLRIELKGGWRS